MQFYMQETCASHLEQKTAGGIRKGQNIYSYLWDVFWPSKVSFAAMSSVSGDFFTRQKHKKEYFPKKNWLKICV